MKSISKVQSYMYYLIYNFFIDNYKQLSSREWIKSIPFEPILLKSISHVGNFWRKKGNFLVYRDSFGRISIQLNIRQPFRQKQIFHKTQIVRESKKETEFWSISSNYIRSNKTFSLFVVSWDIFLNSMLI